MSNLARIGTKSPKVKQEVKAPSDWDSLPEKKRQIAAMRARLINPIIDEIRNGVSANVAIDNLLLKIELNIAPADIAQHAKQLGRKNNPPNRATIYRWVGDYKKGGLVALAPSHKGSARITFGWEARAMHHFARPANPSFGAVSEWLQQEGHENATYTRVRAYLKSLPSDLGEFSRQRLGAKEFRDTQKSYVRRNTEVLPVGFIYQGDGHEADTYIAHPATGKPWRPEITVWIDVRSRYIVGWFISEAESSFSTLFALSHAMLGWDHVPAMLHIDNGSGFKAKMMNDDSLGFYARFDMEPTFAIPGNPKGKGQVERWFLTMEEHYGKTYDSYCGKDMVSQVKSKLIRDVHAGRVKLPSLEVYAQGLTKFVERYNNRPHSSLQKGETPASIWATLERTPIHTPAAAVCRPRKKCSVRRSEIRLHNRSYANPELIQYNMRDVVVEYDIHDDQHIRVLRTLDQAWVCDAKLVMKKDYLPASRIDENQQKRLKGQKKRLQKKIDEAEQRAQISITHDQTLDDIELLNESLTQPLEEQEPNHLEPSFDINEIDILDTDY